MIDKGQTDAIAENTNAIKDIKNGKLVKVGQTANSQVITAQQFFLLEQTERNINNMLRKGDIVYHRDKQIHGYVIKPPTRNTSDCTIAVSYTHLTLTTKRIV